MRANGVIGVGVVVAMVMLGDGQASDIRVQVGNVRDSRANGADFAKLDVELKLLGADVGDIKGLRCKVIKAVDDTGRNLIKEDLVPNEFSAVNSDTPKTPSIVLELKNPARKAIIVKEISGELEIASQVCDPSSVINITNLNDRSRFAVSDPILTAAQIEMTVVTKDQYEKAITTEGKADIQRMDKDMISEVEIISQGNHRILMQIKDPDTKLVKMEFLDEMGKVADADQSMRIGDYSRHDFSKVSPKQLRIWVATSKSVIKLPFSVKDIVLP